MTSNISKFRLPGVRYLLAGAAIASVLATIPASALPINFGGYTGQLTIKFQDYESFTSAAGPVVGSQNFGVFEITSITGGGNILYSAPVTPTAANPLIVGVFSGIMVTGVSGLPPNENTFNSGGVFSLYDDTSLLFGTGIAGQGLAGYAAAGCAINTQCYHGITDMGFDNILNVSLVPGANNTSAQAIASTLFTTITTGAPLTGSAEGYGNITGGSDAGQFGKGGETTGAGTKADIFFQDDFCGVSTASCSGPISNWALGSQDPITAFTAVPEPASVALFGSGLLGLAGFFGWRRRKSV